jgi:putative ABC transport system permease protein
MFYNYLAAAVRHLVRSRFYAAISIAGLAAGICAVLLMLLVARNELGYDRFISGHDRVYLAVSTLQPKQRPADHRPFVSHTLAAALKLKFPQIESAARIAEQTSTLEHGTVRARELLYWADPSVFDVLPTPVVAGNLRAALARPDGIVLPRSIARKYFGQDAPLGATLRLDGRQPLTVTAVIEDLPVNGTGLVSGIFVSSLAPFSALAVLAKSPSNPNAISIDNTTFLRLAREASIESVRAGMAEIAEAQWPRRPPGLDYRIDLLRIDEAHLFPGFNPGGRSRLSMLVAVGLLTLLVASINFVNLSTARASRRAREIAVRKTAGASRFALIVQFMGETLLYVLLATCMGVALTELLLPSVNAFLQTGATLNVRREPALLGWTALGIVALTIAAGIYPALVLSSFRPVTVLKGIFMQVRGSNVARQSLVTLQFATLIGMLVAAAVVHEQRAYALGDALRVPTDLHLMIEAQCRPALSNELRAIPGVRGAGCTSTCLLAADCFASIRLTDGTLSDYGVAPVEAGVLESLGLTPIAGRLFTRAEGSGVVINEQAMRRFGFTSARDAIGKLVPDASTANPPREILGVVKDFSLASVENPIGPMVFSNQERYNLLDVKLTGERVPETLAAIDRLWPRLGLAEPPKRYFLNDHVQRLYRSMLRMAQAFGVMSVVAVLLACLGLVGLSAAATDRRTKEIGIRKAMGAGRNEIVRLLVWQFTKPVIWAAAIACPSSAFLMSRWLNGFAYHIELTPRPFLAAAGVAFALSLLTVSAHSFTAARMKAVQALRYE